MRWVQSCLHTASPGRVLKNPGAWAAIRLINLGGTEASALKKTLQVGDSYVQPKRRL